MGQSLNLRARLSLSTLGLLIATAAQLFPSAVTQVSLPLSLSFVTPSSPSLSLSLSLSVSVSLSLSLFPQLDHRRSRSLEIWDVSRPFQRRHQSFPHLGRWGRGAGRRVVSAGKCEGLHVRGACGVFSLLVEGQDEFVCVCVCVFVFVCVCVCVCMYVYVCARTHGCACVCLCLVRFRGVATLCI